MDSIQHYKANAKWVVYVCLCVYISVVFVCCTCRIKLHYLVLLRCWRLPLLLTPGRRDSI